MKSSEILTHAAELVDRRDNVFWHGLAISLAAGGKKQRDLYDFCFEYNRVWYEDMEHRVMALLLCAAIAEMEGD